MIIRSKIMDFPEYDLLVLELFDPNEKIYHYYLSHSGIEAFTHEFGVAERFSKRDLRRLLETGYFNPYVLYKEECEDIWEELDLEG